MNNSEKSELIHDIPTGESFTFSITLKERPAEYQLVGSVKDYQGYDA